MLDILYDLLTASIGFGVAGYVTPKYFGYGCIATAALTVIYTLLPSFNGATPIDTMAPRLVALWTVFPRAMMRTLEQATAAYGSIGLLATLVVGTIFLVPYLAGIYFGLVTYPELRILGWLI